MASRALIIALMLAPSAAHSAPSGGRFDRWAGPMSAGLTLAGLLVLAAAISIWIGKSPGWAYDFEAYYNAALRLLASGSPYQAETLAGPFRPGPYGLFLYAPPLAVVFVPLTWLGSAAGALVWLMLHIAVLALACALMPVSRTIRLATFGVAALSAPVLFDLNLGNVSLVLTLLAVLAWRWLDRPVSGVALAVALTLRPTMAVIAGWWLVRGVWRPIVWTAISGLLIVAGSLVFIAPGRWFDYLTVLRNVSDMTGVHRNIDLGSALLMFGAPSWAASLALYAGYAIALAAILMSLRRDRELSFVVTLVASLLLAPLLWDHYLTHLIIVAAFLVARGRPWGLLLPLLCWLPTVLVSLDPGLEGRADGLLPFVVLAGLLLPFAAPDRGPPAARRPART